MKKKRAILSIMLALAVNVGALAGCGGSSGSGSGDSDVIKIAIFEPLTGANAGGGQIEKEGVDLGHKLRSEVNGKKVEIVVADNKSDKAEAATVAERLVSQDKVDAVVGSWGSSLAIAAGSIFAENETTAVGASCTNPLVTLNNDYYVRVCFIDSFQGRMLAKYAVEKLGAKTAAIVIEKSNDYSVGLANYFTEAMKEFTGDDNSIVATAEYSTGDQDFNAHLTQISKANPDVIFAPGNFTESAMIIKQARQLGIETQFIGADTWVTPEFIEVGGDAVDGVVISTFFDPEAELTPKTKEFVEAYEKEYGKLPADVTALAYDAYNLVLDAIEKVGTEDRAALNEEIRNTKEWAGATGYISFDENGDATKDVVFKTVKNGEFAYLDTIAADK